MGTEQNQKSFLLFIAIAAFFAVAMAAMSYYNTHIRLILEKTGADILQTEVLIGDLHFSPISKSVQIKSVRVKNPDGFEQPDIIRIDNIRVMLDDYKSDTLAISTAQIQGVTLHIEERNKQNNLVLLTQNADKYVPRTYNATRPVTVKNMRIEKIKLVPAPTLQAKLGDAMDLEPVEIENIGYTHEITMDALVESVTSQLIKDAAVALIDKEIDHKIDAAKDTIAAVGAKISETTIVIGESLKTLGEDIKLSLQSLNGGLGARVLNGQTESGHKLGQQKSE